MPEPLDLNELKRFWRRVDKTDETGCWWWLGALTAREGYGSFSIGSRKDGTRKNVSAHRWIYEQLVGPIPKGLHIDHLCRERRCVNPDHMEPVTLGENVLRGEGPTSRAYRALQAKLKETEKTLEATRAERDNANDTAEIELARAIAQKDRAERAEAERDRFLWQRNEWYDDAVARAERWAQRAERAEAAIARVHDALNLTGYGTKDAMEDAIRAALAECGAQLARQARATLDAEAAIARVEALCDASEDPSLAGTGTWCMVFEGDIRAALRGGQ